MATTPDARVQAFLTDYEEQHRAIAPIFDSVDDGFDLWAEAMGEVTRRHFAPTTTVDLAMMFSEPAEYSTADRIVEARVDGDTALVTVLHDAGLVRTHEYSLVSVGDQWWIERITTFFDDPGAAYLTDDEIAARSAEARTDAPLRDLPDNEAHLDPGSNFVPRRVEVDGVSEEVAVRRVGSLHTGSGILCVIDLGYGNDDARPLARRVLPGTYPVEVSVAFGRNAALRVILDDAEPVSWAPADNASGGHVCGVDAANLCVADFPAYGSLTRRAKEADYDTWAHSELRPNSRTLTFGGDVAIAAVGDSGYGDGAYPVYWGLDVEGWPVQLVIDFMILVTEDEDGHLRHR